MPAAKKKPIALELAQQEVVDEAIKEREEMRQARDRTLKTLHKIRRGRQDYLDTLREAVQDCFAGLTIPPVPAPPKEIRRGTSEIAAIGVADWQLGKRTESYNSDVCEERLHIYGDKIIKLTEIQREDHPIKEAHIWTLGDLCEGEELFKGQAHEIDSSLYEQVRNGSRMLAEFTRRMASVFEKVHVACVPGNHGEIGGESRRRYHKETNADRWMCAWASDLTTAEKRITWDVTKSWYTIDTVGEKRVLLFHGHQQRAKKGVPYKSLEQKILGWSVGGIPEHFDYGFCGHFHTPFFMTINNKQLFGVGSTESGNPYASEQLAAQGNPSQLLSFMHPKRGITGQYQVWL